MLQPSDLLVRALEAVSPLSDDEKNAVRRLPFRMRRMRAREDLVRDGEIPSECCLIVRGFAHWNKISARGARQVISLSIPGDLPDLQSLHLDRLDYNITAAGICEAAFISHADICALIEKHPKIKDILWTLTLRDAARLRMWIVNLGQRDARSRLAHLFCEHAVRLGQAPVGNRVQFQMPFEQALLADAAGMTAIHINRTFRSMRQDGLLTHERGVAVVHDWEGLVSAADFDPQYLHV